MKESECFQERELPLQQWWTALDVLLDSIQTPSEPAHGNPPRRERKSGAALEQDRFLVWSLSLLLLFGWFGFFFFRGDSFVTVFILPPIQSCICDLIPCHQGCASTPGSLGFAARPQGQAGRDSLSRASFSNREQRKLARRPDISISFPVSGMRGSSMPFTLTLTLSHPYTHTPTQEMVGLSEPTVVHKACTSASYI